MGRRERMFGRVGRDVENEALEKLILSSDGSLLLAFIGAGGTVIIGDAAAEAYHTGKGNVLIRAKVSASLFAFAANKWCEWSLKSDS